MRSFIPFSLVLIDLMIYKYQHFHVNDIFFIALDLYRPLVFFAPIVYIMNKHNE